MGLIDFLKYYVIFSAIFSTFVCVYFFRGFLFDFLTRDYVKKERDLLEKDIYRNLLSQKRDTKRSELNFQNLVKIIESDGKISEVELKYFVNFLREDFILDQNRAKQNINLLLKSDTSVRINLIAKSIPFMFDQINKDDISNSAKNIKLGYLKKLFIGKTISRLEVSNLILINLMHETINSLPKKINYKKFQVELDRLGELAKKEIIARM